MVKLLSIDKLRGKFKLLYYMGPTYLKLSKQAFAKIGNSPFIDNTFLCNDTKKIYRKTLGDSLHSTNLRQCLDTGHPPGGDYLPERMASSMVHFKNHSIGIDAPG